MSATHCSATHRETDARVSPSAQADRRESAIMGLLLSTQPPEIWTVDALAGEIREPLHDSLDDLHGQGLIYRWEGYGEEFILVTRAIAHFDQLMTTRA
jgi:hypothetical protein